MKKYKLYIKIKESKKFVYFSEYNDYRKAVIKIKELIKNKSITEGTIEEIQTNTVYREYEPQEKEK